MKRTLIIFLGIIVFSCKQEKNNMVKSWPDTVELERKIDSLYNSYYDENGPAAVILIAYDGKDVLKKAYGQRNIEKGKRADIKKNFRYGSMAKQFTDLALLKLVEEGKIQLSDTLYNYYPYSIFRNVTIEQLISHTSGIGDAEWMVGQDWKSKDYVHLKDIMDWYKNNYITRFKPGSKFEYNNGTYYVLVKLVEDVSGKSFSDYMQEIVFDRIRMDNTYYINDENNGKIPNMAICYEKDSIGNWVSDEFSPFNTLVGPGGLYTNLEDYSKYLNALREHTILDENSHQKIFEPISMNIELHSEDMRSLKGKKSSYAMGWEVTDSLAVSAGLYYGVNNWCVFEFKRPLSFVILTNNPILFKERLVDKTYKIIDDYFTSTTNNGYN
jgi:CubicO group peptidase (beta-lactamase class C family)